MFMNLKESVPNHRAWLREAPPKKGNKNVSELSQRISLNYQIWMLWRTDSPSAVHRPLSASPRKVRNANSGHSSDPLSQASSLCHSTPSG